MNCQPSFTPQPAGALHRVRLLALWSLVLLAATVAWAQAAGARPLPAVVVWDFDNQSATALTPDGQSDFLRRSLSENLTASLLQVAGLPVVERQRLKDLLAEQKVSAGDLADDDARLRLGRIVGASRMVFGGFFVLGTEVQVHVRMIDTATSRVVFSDETTAPVASVMQQVEPLNRRLAQILGGGAVPARSYPAALWQAYDQALALADSGRFDEAVQALQGLLAKDKEFTPAERQLVALLDRMARR
jgi:curli biogenesis system outer membrane secretion channel CsgG